MQQIFVQHLLWAQPFLDAGDTAMNTTDKNPCPNGAYILVNIMTCSIPCLLAAKAGLKPDFLNFSLVIIPLYHSLGKQKI